MRVSSNGLRRSTRARFFSDVVAFAQLRHGSESCQPANATGMSSVDRMVCGLLHNGTPVGVEQSMVSCHVNEFPVNALNDGIVRIDARLPACCARCRNHELPRTLEDSVAGGLPRGVPLQRTDAVLSF
jgi:hypothetical protein